MPAANTDGCSWPLQPAQVCKRRARARIGRKQFRGSAATDLDLRCSSWRSQRGGGSVCTRQGGAAGERRPYSREKICVRVTSSTNVVCRVCSPALHAHASHGLHQGLQRSCEQHGMQQAPVTLQRPDKVAGFTCCRSARCSQCFYTADDAGVLSMCMRRQQKHHAVQ